MKAAMPPRALGAGHDVQGQRGLAARFGAEDFDHAAAGDALAAQGDVQRQAAGGDAADRRGGADAQRHDGPFAELLFDLGQRVLQRRDCRRERRWRRLMRAADLVAVFLAMSGSIPYSSGVEMLVCEHMNSISRTAIGCKADSPAAGGNADRPPSRW